MFLFFLLLFVCSSSTLSSESECKLAQVCVSDLTDEDCGPGYVAVPNVTLGRCCPGCVIDTNGSEEGTYVLNIKTSNI